MVAISRNLYRAILKHLEAVYPEEGCGLIAGRERTAKKLFFLANAERSESSYLADSKALLEAFKEMRKESLELLGIFHSHPHWEAYPSERDRELAFYPDAYYLIVSFQHRKEPQARAFWIREGEVEEETLQVVPD